MPPGEAAPNPGFFSPGGTGGSFLSSPLFPMLAGMFGSAMSEPGSVGDISGQFAAGQGQLQAAQNTIDKRLAQALADPTLTGQPLAATPTIGVGPTPKVGSRLAEEDKKGLL